MQLPPPTWTHSFLIAKPSIIENAGLGVFSTQFITKGTRLADYIGTELTNTEFFKKYPKGQRNFFYSCGPFKLLDGKPFLTQNISHYINESKTPNVYLKGKGLVALTDIQPNDELYLTYPKYTSRDYTL